MEEKGDKAAYGYMGKLSKIHSEMILAMPYFSLQDKRNPIFIGYLPVSQIKECSRGFRCQPASFKDGVPCIRPYYKKFFDDVGLQLIESLEWKDSVIDSRS